MQSPHFIPIWKKAPFIRLLLPLIIGILLQWYLQLTLLYLEISLIFFSIAYLLFFLFPKAFRFTIKPLQGFILLLLIAVSGAMITWHQDTRHKANWYGNFYAPGSYMVVSIEEPLIEKNKSYKADGNVETIVRDGKSISTSGKLLLYFSKDSMAPGLKYGDKIIVQKTIQPIKNSGNPGAFNYQRYAGFQGIYHNVFLKNSDWTLVNSKSISRFNQFIFSARQYVLDVLQNSVHSDYAGSNNDYLGIAKALLIGYTNDLDKDLVQAYSNTGVVHIIAISGMHLALIYVLLVWLFNKIPVINKFKWLQLILILSCLWLFSILTGASPSVLRAAVMFSFIAVGNSFFKQASIYNSLAASAFVLLCYNPYFLWSVGFQLSYLAVLSIVIFQKPICKSIYIKNKWLYKIWELVAVSIAAQLLTFPVCVYYFHQFPNLFLISNMIAVPLSAIILYAEIILVAFSWIPFMQHFVGKLVAELVGFMNKIILWINDLSFAVWDKIPATVLSTWLLYAVVFGIGAWFLQKNKNYLFASLLFFLFFIVQNFYSKWQVNTQSKFIVYNVPQHRAIDFINGRNYQFVGDSILLEDGLLQNFHLKPARIVLQLSNKVDTMPEVFQYNSLYQFNNKKILLINAALRGLPTKPKIPLDVIVVSKNPNVSIAQLLEIFECKQFVFDASNSLWRIEKWIMECNTNNVASYSVPASGAYVSN